MAAAGDEGMLGTVVSRSLRPLGFGLQRVFLEGLCRVKRRFTL